MQTTTLPSPIKTWVLAARPKTLVVGISPVLIGTVLAAVEQPISLSIFALCLLFSFSIQIGANWANDYFDFVKGADTQTRKGPTRAVQAGWIAPSTMRNAAFGAFLCAALFAAPLIWRIGFSYFPLMLLCILCAILYTGGKKPLGYLGFGEALVLFFYGPVATGCSALAQTLSLSVNALIASLIPGLLGCAILIINNLRDADEDAKAGKMTLIARFGKRFGQWEYAFCLSAAAIVPLLLVLRGMTPLLLAVWLLAPLAKKPLEIVFKKTEELNCALALTARLLALYTLLFCGILCAHLYL